jgi:hypothetical protein
MNRGRLRGLQADPTGKAAAAERLLSAHARDGCGQAARRLGRESAGLWAALGGAGGGGNTGGATGPRQPSSWAASRPAGPGEGAREGGKKGPGWAARRRNSPKEEKGFFLFIFSLF